MWQRSVQIAQLAVEIRCDGKHSPLSLPATYDSFYTPRIQADFVLQMHHGVAPPRSAVPREHDWAFFAGGVWAACQWEGGWLFVSPSPRAADWQRELWWLPQEERAHLWVQPDQPAEDPLQNLTLPFFAALFACHRGVLVHAAAVEIQGRAWVFAGPSGSGKSHWTRQWLDRGSTLLDEDRIVLRELDGQLWAFGTPWHVEPHLCSPRGAPLERIFFLQETTPDAVEETTPATATALLLRSCFLPIYDTESTQAVLAVAGRAALQAQVFRLGYATDAGLLDRLGAK